jgi:hypothetical protein
VTWGDTFGFLLLLLLLLLLLVKFDFERLFEEDLEFLLSELVLVLLREVRTPSLDFLMLLLSDELVGSAVVGLMVVASFLFRFSDDLLIFVVVVAVEFVVVIATAAVRLFVDWEDFILFFLTS